MYIKIIIIIMCVQILEGFNFPTSLRLQKYKVK